MKIGILPDIHIGYGDPDDELDALRGIVARFNEQVVPDRVIVLGDLIEDGPDHEADLTNYQQAVKLLSKLSAPVTYLLGNHDVVHLTPGEIESITDQPAWGRIDDTNILYLDSSAPHLPDPRGEVSRDQLDYLDKILATMDWALLFVHHPIHYHDIRTNEWFAEEPEQAFCGNKAAVHRVLDSIDADITVINGHLHETDYTQYRGVDHFTINAFNKASPNADVTGTYGVLTVTDTLTLRITEYSGMTWTLELPRS